MRLVEIAENHPNVCLVTRDPAGPFVDFDAYTEDTDPHIYLSVAIVEQAAALLDLIPRREVEDLQRQIKVMEAELEKIQNIVEAASILEEAGV